MKISKEQRKELPSIKEQILDNFEESDWLNLGCILDASDIIQGHSRLLRSLYHNDDDYEACVIDVLEELIDIDPENFSDIKDYLAESFSITVGIKSEIPKSLKKEMRDNGHDDLAKIETTRDKVFISYSHLDKDFLTDIQRHFKPFLTQFNLWDDTKIQPGQKWKDEIRKAISETKVAILLVSTDFLGSDFITTNELPPLLKAAEENGAVILILILKPCFFEEFSDLNQFQAINPPTRPLIKMDYTEKEETLVNLVRQTKRILNN